jgi:peptidoglycan/LPS O-acetylase OafA/YrhL
MQLNAPGARSVNQQPTYPSADYNQASQERGHREVLMIRQVQYLRGIAAMMVVWYHATLLIPSNAPFIYGEFGKYGVDLFFVISGFIMLVTTWDKPITPMQFIRQRIRRIVPLYWLATIFLVTLAIAFPSKFRVMRFDLIATLKSLLFIPSESLVWPGHARPVLMQGWTLNYEMFFYFLFALLLLVNREWRVRLMVGILSVLVMFGLVLHPSAAPLQVYSDPLLLEFAGGMILGRLWIKKKHLRRDGGNVMLLALGDASYSIYLTHTFVIGLLRVVWTHFVPTATMGSSIALMAVVLTMSAFAGLLCFRFIERSLTKWISKRRLVIRIEVLGEKA